MNTLSKLKIALTTSVIFLTVGCGGGGENASPPPQAQSTTIAVYDGLLTNALVCLDANNNQACDSEEFSLRTNELGVAEIPTNEYNSATPLIARAIAGETIDLDRGAIRESFMLRAPAGYQVVSPFTTLIQNTIETGTTLGDAEQLVAQALAAADNAESAEFYQALLRSNYTTNPAIAVKRVARIGELITDQLAAANHSSTELLQLSTQLAEILAAYDQESLANFYPAVDFNGGVFDIIYNTAPLAEGSIPPQVLDYQGQAISPIRLSDYFSDSENDRLSYHLSPAVAGLSVENGELSGIPFSAGTYQITVTADDGVARSTALIFLLTVSGEVQPLPQSKALVGFSDLGAVPEHNFVLQNKNSLYFVNIFSGGADFVQVEADGTRHTYALTTDWMLDNDWYDGPEFFTGFNPKTYAFVVNGNIYTGRRDHGAGREEIYSPYRIGDDYYLSTYYEGDDGRKARNEDGRYLFKYWRIEFNASGVPSIVERPYDYDTDGDGLADATLTQCEENNHFQGNSCINGFNESLSLLSTTALSEIPNDVQPTVFSNTIHHNGKYYQAYHSSTVVTVLQETVSYNEAEDRYTSAFNKHEVVLAFNDSTGMPVREFDGDLQFFYHEGLDGLVLVAPYENPSDTYYQQSFVYAFIDGVTNKASLVTMHHDSHNDYSDHGDFRSPVVVPSVHGAYLVYTSGTAVEFNVKTMTANEIPIEYPLNYSHPEGKAYQHAEDGFFVLDDDEANLLHSVYK